MNEPSGAVRREIGDLVVFITGGGRGIGRAVAQRFGEAGARVAVAARTTREIEAVAGELTARGSDAIAVPCDVASTPSVTDAVDAVMRRFGRVDVLVNNAGIAESAPVARLDEELWTRTIETNLTGTYRCTRAVVPGMIDRRFGRIINVASVAGLRGHAYVSAYTAAKHGVVGFTRAIALELATKGITVNAICPGYVDTPLTDLAVSRIVETTSRSPEDARRALENMSPFRRLVSPDEIAAAAVFLASPDAHGITGEAIVIGGMQHG
jgi:NAD(P)-dependent dehydrogenase (short-subunit alcohol dehydrogenase family)